MSDSLRPHALYSPWNSLGQNIGVGSLSLLQGIFPIQGSNPGLPHSKTILYQLSHRGSPRILEWVAKSQTKNQEAWVCCDTTANTLGASTIRLMSSSKHPRVSSSLYERQHDTCDPPSVAPHAKAPYTLHWLLICDAELALWTRIHIHKMPSWYSWNNLRLRNETKLNDSEEFKLWPWPSQLPVLASRANNRKNLTATWSCLRSDLRFWEMVLQGDKTVHWKIKVLREAEHLVPSALECHRWAQGLGESTNTSNKITHKVPSNVWQKMTFSLFPYPLCGWMS